MKSIVLSILLLVMFSGAKAQEADPVSWTFGSKKLNNGIYEIQITAIIKQGWHLYSQQQPKDAIAIPTHFTFNKNPLLSFQGSVKEQGKMEKFKDEKLGVAANQYSNKVVFTQRILLKTKAHTNITGKLEFQPCTNQKCLPPKTIPLTISLES